MNTIRTIAACIVALAALPAVARDYTLVDLGTLGGPGSYAAAIANDGTVVGCADVPGAGAHAFAWKDGVMRDLGTGTTTAPEGGSSCALAVSDRGVVAGRAADGQLVVWKGGTVTRLGLTGEVGGINRAGVVAGTASQAGTTRAFTWRDGTITFFGDSASGATGINEKGQVAGRSGAHAFLYDKGVLHDLGTLGGAVSSAAGLNDAAQVVGMATNANGQPLAFHYDVTMTELPAPAYSSAVAINNRDQVVGSAEGTYGFLLDGDVYMRLDTLPAVAARGWRHLEPHAINDHGWIVGSASNPQGDLRAFLLVPKDERGSKPLRSR